MLIILEGLANILGRLPAKISYNLYCKVIQLYNEFERKSK